MRPPTNMQGNSRAEQRSLHARQEGLGLPQCLDLLDAGLLPHVEVLEQVVAARVQVALALRERVDLRDRPVEVHLRLLELLLRLRPLLRPVQDGGLLRLHRLRRLLHVLRVGVLGLGLGVRRRLLHVLRVLDDVLDHQKHAGGLAVLLDSLQVGRRWLAGKWRRRRLLHERGELQLQGVIRLLKQRLGLLLVGHERLVVGLLLLPIRRGLLALLLEVGDLRVQPVNSAVQPGDRQAEPLDLGLEVFLAVQLLRRRPLVLVQPRDACVPVLDLVLLLLQDLRDHVVDRLLDAQKGVQLHGPDQLLDPATVRLGNNLLEQLHRALPLDRIRAPPRNLHKRCRLVVDLGEQLARLIARQDVDRLGHGGNLLLPQLLAILPLLVCQGALNFQPCEELLVGCDRRLCILAVVL
mmetsp:Transcript_34326/g.79648  ORF Transcript_34326/g.79648 Transcript_34326/m.79648 type:complete len:408 (-) Transcript_34326:301-1524(-)